MPSDKEKKLGQLLREDSPLSRQRKSRAAGGFFRYEDRPTAQGKEAAAPPGTGPDDDDPAASTPEDIHEEPTLTLPDEDRAALEAAAPKAAAPKKRPRRAKPRPAPRPLLSPEEVLRLIDAEIDSEAITAAEANFVESGLLFGHQCTLRDVDGNQIYIWSSSSDDEDADALRFYIATDTEVDGVELAPEAALHLGTLLRALQTHVEIQGEEAYAALISALLRYRRYHRSTADRVERSRLRNPAARAQAMACRHSFEVRRRLSSGSFLARNSGRYWAMTFT